MYWGHRKSGINNVHNSRPHIRILTNAPTHRLSTQNRIHIAWFKPVRVVDVSNGIAGMSSQFSNMMEKLMDKVNIVIVYIDNLLIHAQTHEQHLESLDIVMKRLEENNMKINLSKFFLVTLKSAHRAQINTHMHETRKGQTQNCRKSKNSLNH